MKAVHIYFDGSVKQPSSQTFSSLIKTIKRQEKPACSTETHSVRSSTSIQKSSRTDIRHRKLVRLLHELKSATAFVVSEMSYLAKHTTSIENEELHWLKICKCLHRLEARLTYCLEQTSTHSNYSPVMVRQVAEKQNVSWPVIFSSFPAEKSSSLKNIFDSSHLNVCHGGDSLCLEQMRRIRQRRLNKILKLKKPKHRLYHYRKASDNQTRSGGFYCHKCHRRYISGCDSLGVYMNSGVSEEPLSFTNGEVSNFISTGASHPIDYGHSIIGSFNNPSKICGKFDHHESNQFELLGKESLNSDMLFVIPTSVVERHRNETFLNLNSTQYLKLTSPMQQNLIDISGMNVLSSSSSSRQITQTPTAMTTSTSIAVPETALTEFDTHKIALTVRELLSKHNIGQRVFARHVLGLSQGTVSELLSKPKPWSKLTEKGRESYRKMWSWANYPEGVAVLKTLSPRKEQSSGAATSITPVTNTTTSSASTMMCNNVADGSRFNPSWSRNSIVGPGVSKVKGVPEQVEEPKLNGTSAKAVAGRVEIESNPDVEKKIAQILSDARSQMRLLGLKTPIQPKQEETNASNSIVAESARASSTPTVSRLAANRYDGLVQHAVDNSLGSIVQQQTIDTEKLVKQVKQFLSQHCISQRAFGEMVLGLSQGSVSDLLARPKAWSALTQKGREPFLRMQTFLANPFSYERLFNKQAVNTGSSSSSTRQNISNFMQRPLAKDDIVDKSPKHAAADANTFVFSACRGDDADGNRDDGSHNEIDTEAISLRVKEVLATFQIGQRLFGETVLNLSQGTVSELLSKPKPWRLLSAKGREPYQRMWNWINDPTSIQRLVKCKLERSGNQPTAMQQSVLQNVLYSRKRNNNAANNNGIGETINGFGVATTSMNSNSSSNNNTANCCSGDEAPLPFHLAASQLLDILQNHSRHLINNGAQLSPSLIAGTQAVLANPAAQAFFSSISDAFADFSSTQQPNSSAKRKRFTPKRRAAATVVSSMSEWPIARQLDTSLSDNAEDGADRYSIEQAASSNDKSGYSQIDANSNSNDAVVNIVGNGPVHQVMREQQDVEERNTESSPSIESPQLSRRKTATVTDPSAAEIMKLRELFFRKSASK